MFWAKAYSEQIYKLKAEIESADAIVVGAGAGMSAAAGFAYDGERFYRHFSDFNLKYGITDMYSGGFYPKLSPAPSTNLAITGSWAAIR